MKKNLIFFLTFIFVQVVLAEDQRLRDWERVKVDAAYCGDGSAYHFFVSKGSSKKIAFDFMGGGACWSAETCFGEQTKTILKAVKSPIEMDGFLSTNALISPIADYTFVYFPYCTGDVHLGRHTAKYGSRRVRHNGYWNIHLSLQTLISKGLIDPHAISDIAVYGYSAGAIGALVHQKTIEGFFPLAVKKTLVPDSPGLHFGPNFWKKFTPELIADYTMAMSGVGLTLTPTDGFVARGIDRLCQQQAEWRIGFLQSTRDLVMSKIFGDITQEQHENLVLGSEGLRAKTQNPEGNCTAWIPKNEMHTYLISTAIAGATFADGESALSFFQKLMTK